MKALYDRYAAFRERVRARETLLGTWITLGHPAVGELLAECGFDWLVVDMEHSAIGISEAQALIQVISRTGGVPLVRMSDRDPTGIKRVMDAGAAGVIVPDVRDSAQAAASVAAVKYPPAGKRGVGLGRAQGYGLGFETYRDWVTEGSTVIVQIEHVDAVDRIEDIAGTDGIDGVIVGPYDLSASLGIPGELADPRVLELVARVPAAAAAAGISAGFHVVQPDEAQVADRVAQGFNLIGYSLDTLMLGASYRSALDGLRAGRASAG